jgi:hypothetical protein
VCGQRWGWRAERAVAACAGEWGGAGVLRGWVAAGPSGARWRGEMIIGGPGAGQDGKGQIKGLAVTLGQGGRGNNYGGEGVGPSP